MKKIICTVGTSISGGQNDPKKMSGCIEERIKEHSPDTDDGCVKLSAEMHSLYRLELDKDDRVVLISTETEEGSICAEKLRDVIKESTVIPVTDVRVVKIEGLQVTDAQKFKTKGINNFCHAVVSEIEDPSSFRNNIILNPTGGFKGIVPFTTVLGMIFGLKTVYIFERSNALLTLPPLPVSLNEDLFIRARPALKEIDKETEIPEESFFELAGVTSTEERLLFEPFIERTQHSMVTMSPLALVFWSIEELGPQNIKINLDLLKKGEREPEFKEELGRWISKLQSNYWRSIHRHSFSGTDLTVFKPGNVSYRAACVIDDEMVYLCELMQHDQYEREFRKRRKSQYDLTSFANNRVDQSERR